MSSTSHKNILKRNGTTHILTIHTYDQDKIQGYEYLRIGCHDNNYVDITEHFRRCFESARLKGGYVLFHCVYGIFRNVTIVTAYLATGNSKLWANVLTTIKQTRTSANPNVGFRIHLSSLK